MIPITPQLVARLVALGVTMVILQIAAVSQIELFGTNEPVDIPTPQLPPPTPKPQA